MIDLALERAADELNPLARSGVRIGELAHLRPAMRGGLAEALTTFNLLDAYVETSEHDLDLANWRPVPGGRDVAVCDTRSERPLLVGELKLRKIDESLWDLFKMLDARISGGVESAYVIVGASDTDWAGRGACQEIFASELSAYPSASLFASNPGAWLGLLKGGSARPTSVPAHVSTRLLAQQSLVLDGGRGLLRCVEAEPAGSDRLAFDIAWCCGEWPVGVEAPDRYFRWKQKQWRFLKALADIGGSASGPQLVTLAREVGGFNLDKECGLYYGWEPMLRRTRGTREGDLNDAGHRFLRDWAQRLGP